MKVQNKIDFTLDPDSTWIKTEDGFLRCPARVLAEGIMPYPSLGIKNLPDDLKGQKIINAFVPKEEFANPDCISSLEGAAVSMGGHAWMTPEEIRNHQVGSVAGTPHIEETDGKTYLVCDLLFTEPKAIEAVETKELPEISGAYRINMDFDTEGLSFNGAAYNAIQRDLRFNHVAILPEGTGRGGRDIKILNELTAKEKTAMAEGDVPKLVRVKLQHTQKIVNVSDEDAGSIAEESTAAASSGVEGVMSDLEAKTAELEACQAIVEDLKGQLAGFQAKIDELMDPGRVEAAANEMVQEQEEGDEIMENLYDDKDKEGPQKMENMNFSELHGQAKKRDILPRVGMKCENKSDDEVNGMWKTALFFARKETPKKVSGERAMNAKTNAGDAGTQRTAHQRIGVGA